MNVSLIFTCPYTDQEKPNSLTTQIYLKMQFVPMACVHLIEYFDLSLLII